MPDIKLYNCDCLRFIESLPKSTIVVIDPPYGIKWNTDYTRFTLGFDIVRVHRKKVENDDKPFNPVPFLQFKKVVIFGANCFSNKLPCGSWFIWDKRFENGTAFLADGEVAWYSKGHGVYIKSIVQQGCIRPEPIRHPTQKPVKIMEWIIDKISRPEDVIFDGFMGSGTTGVACKLLRRNFIGCEINPEYFELAKRRIDNTEWGLFNSQ